MKQTALLFCILIMLAITAPVMAQGLDPQTPETMAAESSIIQGVTLEPSIEPVTREPTVSALLPTHDLTKEPTTPAAPEVGWVSITSTPSAASVELDGKTIGITPVVGRELGAGISYTVRVSKEGYEPVLCQYHGQSG